MGFQKNSSIHVVPGGASNYGPPFGASFVPNVQYITNITNSYPAIVTFTEETNFTIAENISFRVPPANGMIQLNNQTGKVLAINGNVLTIDVDTRNYFPFISAQDPQVPCIAVPSTSGTIPGTTFVTLEDAFDNEPVA